MSKQSHSQPWLKWIIWALASLFYFYEYLLRISPSVMIPQLMQFFQVDALATGLLIACYLYAYSPMQFLVGSLMDQYGAKKLLSVASFACGIGALVFGLSDYFTLAAIARFVIGAGSAFAFVGMVFVCSHWFPKSKRALMIGLANSIGMLGAMAGGGPLSVAVHRFNWRISMEVLGLIGIILAIAIYAILKDDPKKKKVSKSSSISALLSYIKTVIKSPYTWINGIVASCFYLATPVFGGAWGVPFLQAKYAVDAKLASFAVSMIFFGWLVGGPITGFLSDFLRRRQSIISLNMILTLMALSAVLYAPNLPFWSIYILLFLVGVFSSAELLNFSYAIEINPIFVKGTAIAFTNCLVSLIESIIQPTIGYTIDQVGRSSGSLASYELALSILPIMLFVGWVLSFFVNEKRFLKSATSHSTYMES